MARLAPALVVIGTLLAGSPARAVPSTRVAVLTLESDGELDALAKTMSQTLRTFADERPGWHVVDPGTLSVAEAKLTFACLGEDPLCWAQVGRTLDADRLLLGGVERVPAGVSVTLLLFDAQRPRLMDRVVRTLPKDTAHVAFGQTAREFLTGTGQNADGVLRIAVEQDGAEILVDGESLGKAPVPDAPVKPGRHEIVVRLAGHREWRRAMDTAAGEVVDLRVSLNADVEKRVAAAPSPAPRPPASTPRRGPLRYYLGWGALGLGAALGGVGVTFGLLASAAQGEFDEPDVPQRRAHELKDRGESYAAGANALYGIGAALAVTGAIILASSPDRGPADGTATVVPVLTGDGAGAAAVIRY